MIGLDGHGGLLFLPPPLLEARLRFGVRLRERQAELPSKVVRRPEWGGDAVLYLPEPSDVAVKPA